MNTVLLFFLLFASACFINIYLEKLRRRRDTQNVKFTCDQKCPHCNTWQKDCYGWHSVLESTECDFVGVCGCCKRKSFWVWIGPGICDTIEPLENKINVGAA